jgi:CRISPR-associated protein Csx16
MSTYFITRHPGAVAWALGQGLSIDHTVEHLAIETIQAGDTVIGTLPVHLAAQVCERGAQYRHLAVDIPPHARGGEFTAAELEAYGARLATYHITRID